MAALHRVLVVIAIAAAGCRAPTPPVVPDPTELDVWSVTVDPGAGETLAAAMFADAGAAATDLDPFEHGISAAAGLGARLRAWSAPISVDVGQRVVDEKRVAGDLGGTRVFLGVRETF